MPSITKSISTDIPAVKMLLLVVSGRTSVHSQALLSLRSCQRSSTAEVTDGSRGVDSAWAFTSLPRQRLGEYCCRLDPEPNKTEPRSLRCKVYSVESYRFSWCPPRFTLIWATYSKYITGKSIKIKYIRASRRCGDIWKWTCLAIWAGWSVWTTRASLRSPPASVSLGCLWPCQCFTPVDRHWPLQTGNTGAELQVWRCSHPVIPPSFHPSSF